MYSCTLTDMENTIQWEKVPFYTAQDILQQLSYTDILKATNAIPRLQTVYEQINNCVDTKFIFDGNKDDIMSLKNCSKLREVYIDLSKREEEEGILFMSLLKFATNMKILYIKDDLLLTKTSLLEEKLTNDFSSLEKLLVVSKWYHECDHNMSPLLSRCTALQEFNYKFGNLSHDDMLKLCNLTKIKLISVEIRCSIHFGNALRKMSPKLQHFECYENIDTTPTFKYRTYETIFANLRYLKNLHTLKVMAIKGTDQFENLKELKNLKDLTIVTFRNNFLPKLYDTITQIPVEKIVIEEWNRPNIFPPLEYKPSEFQRKKEYIKDLEDNYANITYIRKISRNDKIFMPLY